MRRRDNGNSGTRLPERWQLQGCNIDRAPGHRARVQSWIHAISTVRRKVSTIFYYSRNKLIYLTGFSVLESLYFCNLPYLLSYN